MFKPIQSLIPKTANRLGVGKQLQAIDICNRYKKVATQILPEQAQNNTFPKWFKNKTLVIGVANSAWAQEVIMRKDAIIDEINSKVGRKVITDLRTQIDTKYLTSSESDIH